MEVSLIMITITVYLSILADDGGVVEACWRAIERLRSFYGVTVFLEVFEISLLNIVSNYGPLVVVGDVVIEVRGFSLEELVDRIVDAVLKAVAFKPKGEVVDLDLLYSTQAPGEFMEIA